MSRAIMMVFLLVILIVTCQFEWRQPIVELEAAPNSFSQKHKQVSIREEAVKEKIILSQERHIQRLNDLVRSLQMKLLRCKGENETRNATETFHLNKHFVELERKHIVED